MLYRTGILPIRSSGEHPVDPQDWARVRREVRTFLANEPAGCRDLTLHGFVHAIVMGLIPGALFSIAFSIALVTNTFHRGMLVLMVPVLGAPIGMTVWKRRCGFYEFRPRPIIGAMLRQWLCPACAYSLRTVPPADDGCRVCPECGGAWKIEGATVEGDSP